MRFVLLLSLLVPALHACTTSVGGEPGSDKDGYVIGSVERAELTISDGRASVSGALDESGALAYEFEIDEAELRRHNAIHLDVNLWSFTEAFWAAGSHYLTGSIDDDLPTLEAVRIYRWAEPEFDEQGRAFGAVLDWILWREVPLSRGHAQISSVLPGPGKYLVFITGNDVAAKQHEVVDVELESLHLEVSEERFDLVVSVVTDDPIPTPVPNIAVSVGDSLGGTDDQGIARLHDVPPGLWTVKLGAYGLLRDVRGDSLVRIESAPGLIRQRISALELACWQQGECELAE